MTRSLCFFIKLSYMHTDVLNFFLANHFCYLQNGLGLPNEKFMHNNYVLNRSMSSVEKGYGERDRDRERQRDLLKRLHTWTLI